MKDMEEIKTRLAEVIRKGDCSKHKTTEKMLNMFKRSIDDLWVDREHKETSKNNFE